MAVRMHFNLHMTLWSHHTEAGVTSVHHPDISRAVRTREFTEPSDTLLYSTGTPAPRGACFSHLAPLTLAPLFRGL